MLKKIRPYIRKYFERADVFLLVVCLISSILGTVMISSAVSAYTSPGRYIFIQIFSIFLGVAAFVLFTVIDSDILGENWQWLCVINVGLLILLVFFGQDDGTGNKAWIRFAGIGIQPSEVIKVLYIIISAYQMTFIKEHGDINSFRSVVMMAGHFIVVFGIFAHTRIFYCITGVFSIF